MEPSRYRPLLGVLLAVGLALAALNTLLLLATGPAPALLARTAVLSPEELGYVAARVAETEREREGTALPGPSGIPRTRLVVIGGFSTALLGIDPEGLESASPGWRVVSLAGTGASFRELRYYLRPLARSTLRPDLVILGVHPSWLVVRAGQGPGPSRPGLRAALARWAWVRANSPRIGVSIRVGLVEARLRIGSWFGLPIAVLAPPGTERAWTPPVQRGEAGVYGATQMEGWARAGWFDPASYDASGPEARELGELLERLGAVTSRVAIVLMPESEPLRERLPEEAERALVTAVRSAAPQSPVIDLRASVPEEEFWDRIHLYPKGRERLTRLLAERLSPWMRPSTASGR